jgi:hypothetical protein
MAFSSAPPLRSERCVKQWVKAPGTKSQKTNKSEAKSAKSEKGKEK